MASVSPVTIRRARRDDVGTIIAMLADDRLGGARERLEDPLPQVYFDAFERVARFDDPVAFDRGLPDTVGFFRLEGIAIHEDLERACLDLRYNGPIFRAPPWRAIYGVDEQRVQTWHEAVGSDAAVIAAWRHFGYNPIDLPLASVAERVEFVLERITASLDRI